MSKIYKNIIKTSFLIVGLVILSHSVIPHDHHYDFAYEIEHNHNDDSDKAPIHCHYFNNIDFDKVRTNNFTNVIHKLPIVYTILLSNLYNLNINYQESIFINTKDNLPDYSFLISISPTRGSPLS